jgi:hypothetical protein
MPLRHAGLGLRPSSRVAHIAFLAALAALMPLTAFNPHFLAWADLEDILRTLHNFLPDLKKTLKAASEETVINAIEALKDQLSRQEIPNPGGWLAGLKRSTRVESSIIVTE